MADFKMALIIPIGMNSDFGDVVDFELPINKIRSLEKHKGDSLHLSIKIDRGPLPTGDFKKIPTREAYFSDPELISILAGALTEEKDRYTLTCTVRESIRNISSNYTASEDIYMDLVFGIGVYLQATLFLFGMARLLPVVITSDREILLNRRLFHHKNPWQDWFNDPDNLSIMTDEKIYKQTNSSVAFFEKLREHVSQEERILNVMDLKTFLKSSDSKKESVFNLGRILSECIYLHPSYDLPLIIGLLTAFIESLLKIKRNHTFNFKDKLSNLMHDRQLMPVWDKIYRQRSYFFHHGIYEAPENVFEFLHVELLFIAIRKILKTSFIEPINKGSFSSAKKSSGLYAAVHRLNAAIHTVFNSWPSTKEPR